MLTATQQIALSHSGQKRYSLRALGCDGEQPLHESAFGSSKDILKDLIQIGLSTGAIVGTAGMGGDTIVDVLFALDESAKMAAEIDEVIKTGKSLGKALKGIGDINIRNGFDVIYKRVQGVIAHIVKLSGKGARKVLKEIRDEILKLLHHMARVIGKWVSSLLPDDAGLGGPIVSAFIDKAIEEASANVYNALVSGFEALPDEASEVMKDPAKMEAFLNKVLDVVVGFLNGVIDPETWGQSAAKYAAKFASIGIISSATSGAGAIPAAVGASVGADTAMIKKVRDHLDTTVRQMIPVAVKTFQAMLSAFLAQVAILQVIMAEDYRKAKKPAKPGEKKPDEAPAPETPDAPEPEAAPAEEPPEEEKLAASFNPKGTTISELRQYIRHSLETE